MTTSDRRALPLSLRSLRLPLVGLVALTAACTSTLGSSDPNGGGGGGGGGNDEFGSADAGNSCAEVRPIAVEQGDPPDLLLVVDKSGSMDQNINGQSKWSTMRSALSTTLSGNANAINFGLMLYPTDNDCGAGNISAPVTSGSGDAIFGALNGVNPNGGTPTHTSLQNALSYYQSTPVNPNGRFVLLATDGEPNCLFTDDPQFPSINESVAAITALKQAGIPTFVLGFGNGVNASTLQAMAQAGGQGQYYAANSPAELATALSVITGAVALPDCTFTLGEVPPDVTRLRLFFDDAEVSRSSQHSDGWDYDANANSVTIYGASCDTLQGGGVGEVRVDYGCSGATVD